MTLRPCTVTQFNNISWRVDWEDDGVHRCFLPARGHAVIRYRGPASYWFDDRVCGDSIDDVLERVGLTRHEPKPEAAEERVRSAASSDAGRIVLNREDLCEVLAELDRLRAEKPEPDTITPRDLFAQAWLRNENHWQNHRDDIAKRAFEMADAMMKARGER